MTTRREFLRISSSAALAVAASGLVDSHSIFAATSNAPLLAIGYGDTYPAAGRTVRLGPVAANMGGDPTFLSRGARLSLLGFGRAEQYAGAPGGMAFCPIFPVLSKTPENYPLFHAWSYCGDGSGGDTFGGPITFRMPVTAKDGVQFAISRTGSKVSKRRITGTVPPPAEERSIVSLGVNSGGDAALRGGVYVFAFRESAADREPAWSQYVVRCCDGALSVPNLNVSYLVMLVDYDQA
jgi:hypothetical protein